MALRVLLADESSTIKKVMQLALQDFGVEVRSVAVGLDVLQVARAYQPDLIFTDVLLAKKSGYEVSADLKADPELKKIPVVLMWSSFMELDEAKARTSKADRRLEKPFDADQLRNIVKEVVPRLQQNQISNFLSFPDLPEIVETPVPPPSIPMRAPVAPTPPTPPAQATSPFSASKKVPHSLQTPPPPGARDEVDEPDDFMQVPLPGAQTRPSFERPDREEWRQGGLEQFRVAPDEIDPGADLADVSDAHIAMTDGVENMDLDELDKPAPRKQVSGNPSYAFDPMHAEEILRAQVREVLENVAWKIIPDIVERVVREEIQRLLKEAERF